MSIKATVLMTKEGVEAYVAQKWPSALQSPLALLTRELVKNDEDMLAAADWAGTCLDATDGWCVDSLSHNIESSFPDLEREDCDAIAEAALAARRMIALQS